MLLARQHRSFTVPGHGELEILLVGELQQPNQSIPTANLPSEAISGIRLAGLSNTWLQLAIAEHCKKSRDRFDQNFSLEDGELLVIKYIPATRLGSVLGTGRLFAANGPGYTWGDAVYVSPIDTPFSTMMYGDVGIVGRYTPNTVFDGSDPYGMSLYQTWIQTQFSWYDLLTTTIHSDVANRFLRNRFRTTFGIDCVFFKPDQFAANYVRRSDYWLAVSHWIPDPSGRRVAGGPTSVIQDLEFSVVISERFDGNRSKFFYNPLLGAELRRRTTDALPLQLTSVAYRNALRTAYAARNNNPKPPVYVTHEQP